MTFLESIADRIHRLSGAIGIDPYHARLLAEQLVRELTQEHGGERVYVASGDDRSQMQDRDAAIRSDRARGLSVRRLSRKYLLSVGRVHKILSERSSFRLTE